MARPTYDVIFCDQLLADRTAQAERAVQAAVDAKNEVRRIKNKLYICWSGIQCDISVH